MSVRRHVRMRREYLYRKSLEGTERTIYERKRKIKEALDSGKPIPTELQADEPALRAELERDDDYTLAPKSRIDDEYANAGVQDPKVCVTTSRDPSSRLKMFVKELKLVFPNSQRINRGGYKVEELVEACRSNDFTDIVIVQEHRGEPDGLVVCHLPYGPTVRFSMSNVVMRHDIEGRATVSEVFPHLVFHEFNSQLGDRVKNALKFLFPVPKLESKRVMSFVNEKDFISFRHHVYRKVDGKEDQIELTEVGPRFELQPFEIRLGTIDRPEAEVEWTLRSFTNTAKKKRLL
jgi:U3 small nucleolar ribonucleoprotein protein IMP4